MNKEIEYFINLLDQDGFCIEDYENCKDFLIKFKDRYNELKKGFDKLFLRRNVYKKRYLNQKKKIE